MMDVSVLELAAGFAIALVLMVAEYLLCTKLKNPLWGGIISLAWLVLLAAAFSHGMVNWPQDWKIIVSPTLIFFFMWAEGHEAARKKRTCKDEGSGYGITNTEEQQFKKRREEVLLFAAVFL